MQIEVLRDSLRIYPESEIDMAYLESILELKYSGSDIRLVRHDVNDLDLDFYLETKK